MTVTREFTKYIQLFLHKEGYSHILSIGIRDQRENDYFLIPLKPNDERLTFHESDYIIEEILSEEINEMATGDEFITFWIELPKEVNEKLILELWILE